MTSRSSAGGATAAATAGGGTATAGATAVGTSGGVGASVSSPPKRKLTRQEEEHEAFKNRCVVGFVCL